MPTSIAPLFFDQVAKSRLITSIQSKDRVEEIALPVIQKLGALPGTHSCLPSANKEHTVADASQAVRAFDDGLGSISKTVPGMQGGSFVGLTTLSYAVIGAAQAYDSCKQSARSERIGDQEGAHLARLQAVENAFLAAGSTVMMPLRGISMAQDIIQATRNAPLALNSATSITQSVFSWASVVLYTIYYVLNGIRYGWGLINWYQGRTWRKELLASNNPVKILMGQLQQRVQDLDLTAEGYKKLALDAGVRWLEKVAKEAKQNGIKLEFKDPAAAFERYMQLHPEMVEGLLGKCPVQLTWEGELIRLGRYLAIQNECAKFEAECARKLGSKTVEALKTQGTAKIKEALSSKEGVYLAVKVALAVIGLTALIAATVFSGGVGLGVILGLYGLGALISIYLEDWSALKEHLDKGELRKRDRFFIYFSTCLSIVAVGGLVALTVLSGGATAYLAALILTTAWVVINLRAVIILSKHDSHSSIQAVEKPISEAHQKQHQQLMEDLKEAADHKLFLKKLFQGRIAVQQMTEK